MPLPIGGLRQEGKHGYFIATSKDELAEAITPLESRTRHMNERLTALSRLIFRGDMMVKIIITDQQQNKEYQLPPRLWKPNRRSKW